MFLIVNSHFKGKSFTRLMTGIDLVISTCYYLANPPPPQIDWWTDKSRKNYEEKMECLQDHYSKFKADDMKINAESTLTENTADVGGLTLARMAYQGTHIYQMEKKSQLPGLENYNADQLFYISFGQLWCEKHTDQSLKMQIRYDEHAPGEVRVSGTVSLIHDFAKTFNCPRGSPMYPEEQCLRKQ